MTRAGVGTAFVMGAGMGTRLRPLTLKRPKPLIPIYGKPLITFALDHLIAAGVERFVINTHHLAGQFDGEFSGGAYRGRPVTLVFEPVLLETGGGIKNAETFLGSESFLVYSGDVLTDLPIEPLLDEHFRRGNDVTLALRDTGLAAGVALEDGRVSGLRGKGTPGAHDFANVSVWNPSAFARFQPGEKISFVHVLSDWMADGGRIGGVVLNQNDWFNVGSRDEYLDVHRTIGASGWRPEWVSEETWPARIAGDARVSEGARIEGVVHVGAGCVVESGAVVSDSVLWPGAVVRSGAHLRDCVVTESLVISGEHVSQDLTESP